MWLEISSKTKYTYHSSNMLEMNEMIKHFWVLAHVFFYFVYEMASHIPWLNDSTLIFFTTYGNTSSFFVQKDHGVMTKGPRINILWKIRTKVSQKNFGDHIETLWIFKNQKYSLALLLNQCKIQYKKRRIRVMVCGEFKGSRNIIALL